MPERVLILGGTAEAASLAERLTAQPGIGVTTALAGRTRVPRSLPGHVRVGGFGGAQGLAAYLRTHGIDQLVDATHPDAARITANATRAAHLTGVPITRLTRPPWRPGPGDRWLRVPDLAAAASAVSGVPGPVLLAVGRHASAAFAACRAPSLIARVAEESAAPPVPGARTVVARGPFELAEERGFFADHGITAVVCKNSGGAGAAAKLTVARERGCPVIMVARPPEPPLPRAFAVADAERRVTAHAERFGRSTWAWRGS